MKSLVCSFASAILVVVAAQPAGAASATTATANAERPDWSLGAGIGFGSLLTYGALPLGGLAGLGSLGALGSLSITPHVMVERRLGSRVWLLFRLSGAVSANEASDHATASSRSVSGDVGVRYVFNPDGAFEASGTVTVGGAYGHSTLSDTAESIAASFTARVGVAVDRELTEGLRLRLALSVLQAGYNYAETSAEDGALTSADGAFAQLTLSPSLELRYVF